MIPEKIRNQLHRLQKRLIKNPVRFQPEDSFLREISGVVHVGANTGQERELYEANGLSVIWVEPIPEVFENLLANIRGFKNQRALKALVTDVDDKEYEFHVSNNGGESSSILSLGQHKDIWPDVYYKHSITIKSTTLAKLFSVQNIDASNYQALIMDTQGSELLVLKGSLPILDNFKFIKTEVADFESYEGCCQLSELDAFMVEHGYKEFSRRKFAERTEGGSYFNIVYRKQA